jgi:hypothetical protein
MLENLTAVVTTYRINWRSIIDFLISIKDSQNTFQNQRV